MTEPLMVHSYAELRIYYMVVLKFETKKELCYPQGTTEPKTESEKLVLLQSEEMITVRDGDTDLHHVPDTIGTEKSTPVHKVC